MKTILITISLVIAYGSYANNNVKNEIADNSVTVESSIVYDKRKRARRRWKRKHNAPKSNCTKRVRIRVR
jgi:hypothetical protein